ncbi:hypothetical protein SAMN04487886_10949 [Clostridium sp. DSM 8431]|uniref:DUF6179 domain-containing protein n=1 Tax=Clostridium sp. DSM 8431 TaxID=1761781 RepID=UPI0008ECB570|nr:DUF6179 domain-containing protein [Clostridium sp. DSM 8431]SFU66822.1 hypothetical protein SAMN04487886_10949 [Clostridium sp. DSM 8431]
MKIIKRGLLSEDIRNLSSELFLLKLLECYASEKILTSEKVEGILYERIGLLKEKLVYYTKNESSSINEEEAESILTGIDYTLGMYLKTLDEEKLINELRSENLKCILDKGEKLIKAKVEENRILFEKIKREKLRVNNYSYDDTIEYGLSVFFSKYDVFFKSQDTPCFIDYQLPVDIMKYKGIEYIEKYLKILNFESEFCNKFAEKKLRKLLKSYDEKYEELLINIFELTLINALGRFMCDRDLLDLELTENDVLQIKYQYENLSLDESFEKFIQGLKGLLNKLEIKDEELFRYASYIIQNDFEFIYNILKEDDAVRKIFITIPIEKEKETIEYVDGKKLSDFMFRKYTEKIRECTSISKKTEIINSNFKSLQDIVDMFHSDCLFNDEYYYYFNNIQDIQMALLYKYFIDRSLEDQYEEEWCNYLKKYILSLSKEKQEEMKKIIDKIKFI